MPRVSSTRGKNLAPTSLADSKYLLLFDCSLCAAKYPGESIAAEIVWLLDGLGCVTVTSASMVTQSLSVTIKSILPAGGLNPCVGGAIWETKVSTVTGSLAALVIEAMHWLIAVWRMSHSLPLLHFIR